MFKSITIIIIVIFGLVPAYCATNWIQKARLVDSEGYFVKVITAAVATMEKYEWSNFKVREIKQTVNQRMYNWHVNGTVVYKNGFLMSVDNISVEKITAVFSKPASTNISQVVLNGDLSFNHARIGFDVEANIDGNAATQHFTGVYRYNLIKMRFALNRNLKDKTFRVSGFFDTIRGETNALMEFMPSNSLTEVLSRVFILSFVADSVDDWIKTISTMIQDAAENKVAFPEICFSCT